MHIIALLFSAFAASAVAKVDKDCNVEGATMCSQHRHHTMWCLNGKWTDIEDCDDMDMHCDMVVVDGGNQNDTVPGVNNAPLPSVAKCVK